MAATDRQKGEGEMQLSISYSDSVSIICQKLSLRQRRSKNSRADIVRLSGERGFVPVSDKAREAIKQHSLALVSAGWTISLKEDGSTPWHVERIAGSRGFLSCIVSKEDGTSAGFSANAETLQALEAIGAMLTSPHFPWFTVRGYVGNAICSAGSLRRAVELASVYGRKVRNIDERPSIHYGTPFRSYSATGELQSFKDRNGIWQTAEGRQ